MTGLEKIHCRVLHIANLVMYVWTMAWCAKNSLIFRVFVLVKHLALNLIYYCTIHHFIQPRKQSSYYQHSFFPRTIKDWNSLPVTVIELENVDTFTKYLLSIAVCFMHMCDFFGMLITPWAYQQLPSTQ